MAQQKPKKPQKPKRLNLSSRNHWKNILKDIDKKNVPVHVLEKLLVYLKDGTTVVVDIKQLLSQGHDADLIQEHIEDRLKQLDMYIDDVDYFIDIDSVEATVQPQTNKLLNKL